MSKKDNEFESGFEFEHFELEPEQKSPEVFIGHGKLKVEFSNLFGLEKPKTHEKINEGFDFCEDSEDDFFIPSLDSHKDEVQDFNLDKLRWNFTSRDLLKVIENNLENKKELSNPDVVTFFEKVFPMMESADNQKVFLSGETPYRLWSLIGIEKAIFELQAIYMSTTHSFDDFGPEEKVLNMFHEFKNKYGVSFPLWLENYLLIGDENTAKTILQVTSVWQRCKSDVMKQLQALINIAKTGLR